MFKKGSLRIRYLISYVLMLLTVVIFLSMLYSIYRNNNQRYINTATLEKFTYATESISAMIDRMDVAAANAAGAGDTVRSGEALPESRVPIMLGSIEDSMADTPARVLYYRRGDSDIWTSEGRQPYAAFEDAYRDRYDFTMSRLFSALLSRRESVLLPILGLDGTPGAVAYVIPFADGQLIFLVSGEVIAGEFAGHLGDLPGDLYVYTSRYVLLFRQTEGPEEMLPFPTLIRQRGVGLQPSGGDGVLLSVSDARKGLNFAFVCRSAVFYQDMQRPARFILGLIIALVLLLSALFWWFTLINYKPIQRLVKDITDQEYTDISSNELSLIRSTYNRTAEEAEQLNSRLTELTPLLTQHLVSRMAHGQIQDRKTLDDLTRYARVTLSGPAYAAMCLRSAGEEENADPGVMQQLERFALPEVTVMWGEMPDENALCLIANFGGAEDANAAAEEIAAKVLDFLLTKCGRSFRIGVGCSYQDPLRVGDSYSEARAALQLAPAGRKTGVFPYVSGPSESYETDSLHQLPPMLCSLMTGALRRGEGPVARRALNEILAAVGSTTDSLMYYRFYAVNLSSLLLRAAEEEGIALTSAETRPLVSFASRQEFEQSILALIDDLCRRIGEQHTQQDLIVREKLMKYILDHYKDADLSVQSAAEAVGIPRVQVSAIVREDTGLNFVQYVSYLRMNEFKRLLAESDMPITECVMAIGYQDAPNFLRKFKAQEGVTAGQYRAGYGKKS